jgi:prepilin-type N-terminal cleavage/methylation domain-containing protein
MRRRLRGAGQDGFTIVELLVAMTVLAIALTLVYGAFESLGGGVEGATDRIVNLDEARLLMDTMTKDLRTAVTLSASIPAFASADDRSVTFYGNLNSTEPRKIEIFVDANNRLVERVTLPSGSAPYTAASFSGTPIVRVVGSYVSGTAPIFKYIKTDGTEWDASQTPLSTSTDLSSIGAVEVTIAIQKTSRRLTNPTTLTDRVRLPNILNNLTTT